METLPLIPKSIKLLIYSFVVATTLLSCNKASNNEVRIGAYPSVASIIDNQCKVLVTTKASLYKDAVVDGVAQRANVNVKDWVKELGILKEADISKPADDGKYTVSLVTPQETLYKAKDDKANVRWLVLGFDKGEISKIKAELFFGSILNTTYRQLEVDFVPTSKGALIARYQVKGTEKVILRDTSAYTLDVHVLQLPK